MMTGLRLHVAKLPADESKIFAGVMDHAAFQGRTDRGRHRGHQADFHSLWHTLATNLVRARGWVLV
jgi:hypothetical protein